MDMEVFRDNRSLEIETCEDTSRPLMEENLENKTEETNMDSEKNKNFEKTSTAEDTVKSERKILISKLMQQILLNTNYAMLVSLRLLNDPPGPSRISGHLFCKWLRLWKKKPVGWCLVDN